MTNKKPVIYTKSLNHKMTLRLTDELITYVNLMSDKYAISPSDYIRQCIAKDKDSREVAQDLITKVGKNLTKEINENGTDRIINYKL